MARTLNFPSPDNARSGSPLIYVRLRCGILLVVCIHRGEELVSVEEVTQSGPVLQSCVERLVYALL
jgi:hypothetical protein